MIGYPSNTHRREKYAIRCRHCKEEGIQIECAEIFETAFHDFLDLVSIFSHVHANVADVGQAADALKQILTSSSMKQQRTDVT